MNSEYQVNGEDGLVTARVMLSHGEAESSVDQHQAEG